MKLLTAQEILGSDDIRKELVEVSEWGGSVYVRGMTGMERSEYQSRLFETDSDGNRTLNLRGSDIFLAAVCMCDDNNVRLFTDDQVEELGRKSSQAIARITEVAQRLSAITAEDVDELEGNSSETPADDSSSS